MLCETIPGTRNIYGMEAITVGREEKHSPCQNICMRSKKACASSGASNHSVCWIKNLLRVMSSIFGGRKTNTILTVLSIEPNDHNDDDDNC